jgi:hypothetical protein
MLCARVPFSFAPQVTTGAAKAATANYVGQVLLLRQMRRQDDGATKDAKAPAQKAAATQATSKPERSTPTFTQAAMGRM